MAKEAEAECAEYRTRLEDYSDYDEVRRSCEKKMGRGGRRGGIDWIVT
jgi:hypothetical protein